MTLFQQRLLAVALILFLVLLFLLAWAISTLGHPDEATIKAAVEDRLPPGAQKFEVVNYEQDTGELWIRFRLPTYGDPIGYEFEVTCFPNHLADNADVVVVDAYRRQNWDRLKLADYVFHDGQLREIRFLNASAAEGPRLEELAKQLDGAVRGAY